MQCQEGQEMQWDIAGHFLGEAKRGILEAADTIPQTTTSMPAGLRGGRGEKERI